MSPAPPLTDPRRARGALGERLAAAHLGARGYRLVEANYRTRYGELDLVLAGEDALVFCEVKTVVSGRAAGPGAALAAIGPRKRRQVRRMAAQWLADRRAAGDGRPQRRTLRFDAVGVTLAPGGELISVEHVPDAF